MPAKAKARPRDARWLELAAEFPLRPLRSEKEYKQARAMIDRLTDQEELTEEEHDYRDALGILVADYEDEHVPEPEVSPANMLRHLIDVRGVASKDVADGSGISEATVSQILTGKRQPSRRAITALSEFFKVDPAVFL